MAPVRACVRPYMQNFLTATPDSVLGGIVSNFQGLQELLPMHICEERTNGQDLHRPRITCASPLRVRGIQG